MFSQMSWRRKIITSIHWALVSCGTILSASYVWTHFILTSHRNIFAHFTGKKPVSQRLICTKLLYHIKDTLNCRHLIILIKQRKNVAILIVRCHHLIDTTWFQWCFVKCENLYLRINKIRHMREIQSKGRQFGSSSVCYSAS